MSLWIKICGNTSAGDAQLAAGAGANAVGFVFAPGPRQVTAALVASIAPALPDTVEKIGVFVDASFDEIESTVCASGLTGVQLHFDAAANLPGRLRKRFGPALRILRVIHFGAGAARSAVHADADPDVDAVLVDSYSAKAAGGTGVAFEWAAAKTLFQNPEARKRIAAGGLTPVNVAEAIAALRPWGVDVVSGLEISPGRKDPDKVRDFIRNARAAESA